MQADDVLPGKDSEPLKYRSKVWSMLRAQPEVGPQFAHGGGGRVLHAGEVRLDGGSEGLKYPPKVCSMPWMTRSVLIIGLPEASVPTRLR